MNSRTSLIALALTGLPIVWAGAAAAAPGATPTTTTEATTPPTSSSTSPTSSSTSTPPPTSAAPTSTSTTAAPTTTVPNRLAGVNWIQAAYPSPCSDSTVQLVAGAVLDGPNRAVLDDVVDVDPAAGLALAFLSCRAPGPATTQTTAVVVRVRSGTLEALAERELGAAARVIDVAGPRFTVETPASPARRQLTLTAGHDSFRVTGDETVPASTPAAGAAVGGDADLVRRSVPRTALCYRWDNVWLTVPSEPAEATALREPSSELQTIRLALIHLTGRWIDPTGEMSAEMAAVVSAYQEGRGLVVDGAVGNQTTRALAADLGCADTGGFAMVAPTGLGPRGFAGVAQLVAATDRFARTGRSGYASINQLLRDSHWDGRNALFLGCYRWESPSTGLSCSWSGPTPLQLVGLVDDPATPGLGSFSILYARSTN